MRSAAILAILAVMACSSPTAPLGLDEGELSPERAPSVTGYWLGVSERGDSLWLMLIQSDTEVVGEARFVDVGPLDVKGTYHPPSTHLELDFWPTNLYVRGTVSPDRIDGWLHQEFRAYHDSVSIVFRRRPGTA